MTTASNQTREKRLPRIYRLRITVDKVEPALWRQIEVEGDAPIDFVADAIRCALGWSFTHAYKFVIKKRHYGTHNDWVRDDPEQTYEERRREIEKRKLSPRKTREAILALSDWHEEAMESVDPDDEDAIPSLEELVPRVRTKFKFIFDFGDWWEHTVEGRERSCMKCWTRCRGDCKRSATGKADDQSIPKRVYCSLPNGSLP